MATDNRVELLFLLGNGFEHDFVRFLLLHGGSGLVKGDTAMSCKLRTSMMYSRHVARIRWISKNQGRVVGLST